MMVTRCWRQKDNIGDVFRYVTDAFNIIGRSSTSQSCHKHIPSPTSVTNIDVVKLAEANKWPSSILKTILSKLKLSFFLNKDF